ncbi:MAG: alpha/beta hydrolase-fold protein, partial [Gemmatimonadota bacterium]
MSTDSRLLPFPATAGLAAGLLLVTGISACAPPAGPSFEVTLAAPAFDALAALGLETPVKGRLFVILTRDTAREPRLQTDVTGVPFWGMDVHDLGPGSTVTLADGEDVYGYPLPTLDALPPGEYTAQALLNVYTTFSRADGKVVEMHNETGEGQNLWRSPGNPVSEPVRVTIGAGASPVRLEIVNVIPPIEPVPEDGVLQQGNPADGRLTRFVKMRSEKLSTFWGHDMYIGANVLLPRDYDSRPNERYPVIWVQGHFPGRRAPFGYSEDGSRRGADFTRFWLSDEAPRVILVSIRDANPFYDTSYSVNSANVGPWGDAIVDELMPMLERTFRIISERWARVTAGGSTGGWEALAAQIFYPDVFGGAWGWCPDPVDFRYYQIVNVYDDPNAYFVEDDWQRVERPGARRPDGNIRYMMR